MLLYIYICIYILKPSGRVKNCIHPSMRNVNTRYCVDIYKDFVEEILTYYKVYYVFVLHKFSRP